MSYSGAKAWIVMTRTSGKLIRLTLGRFPNLTLAEARTKARDAIEAAAAGGDPRELEKERRSQQEAAAQNTYGALVEKFMEEHVRAHLRPSTGREYQRILLGNDTKPWRKRPISSIQQRDVEDLLRAIQKRASKGASTLTFAYLRGFFNWCVEEEKAIAVPPTAGMRRKPLPSRERVLTAEELRLIWRAFEAEPGFFGSLFKLLILTGQRRGEVAGMRWDELRDLETNSACWEIPSDRTKNHKPHLVFLAPDLSSSFSRYRAPGRSFSLATTRHRLLALASPNSASISELQKRGQLPKARRCPRGGCMTCDEPS